MSTGEAILDPTIGWFLLGLFSVLWVALGLYWGRRNKSFEDHALAGRNVGLALASATAVATWITSNTTMLAPQFALELGIWGMLAYSMAAFGLILFAPMATRIRMLMPNGYTSGDFFRLRYGRGAWSIFMLFTLFYSLTWLVSMAMAGGILLNALSGIPYQWGMSVILLVCVLYTMRGGLTAVIGTDPDRDRGRRLRRAQPRHGGRDPCQPDRLETDAGQRAVPRGTDGHLQQLPVWPRRGLSQ